MERICRMRKMAFILCMILLWGAFGVQAQELGVAQKAQSYLMAQEEEYSSNADWNLFALARSGAADLPAEAHMQRMGTYLQETISARGHLTYATDYARMALVADALGYDARNVTGVDLIGELCKSDLVEKQGLNGYIYTLLALDSEDYSLPADALWTADKLVEKICALQKEKGYFVFTDNFGADVDLTAAAVTALAPHRQQETAAAAVEKAINWLAEVQLDTAGYAGMGVENSMSAAQVLTALCAVGIDPTQDVRFIKQGRTIVDYLTDSAAPEGGFRYLMTDTEANEMATTQVLYALSAWERLRGGKAGLFDLRDVQRKYAAGGAPSQVEITDLEAASDWARDAIVQAVQQGIVKGYTDGSFAPQKPITRAEFLALLVRILAYQPEAGQTEPTDLYADVTKSDWFYEELKNAAAGGLITPNTQDTFRPNDPLTREEMAVFLSRSGLFETAESARLADDADISAWAKTGVYTVYQAGIMQGDGGYFDPQGTVTREMVAIVGMRLQGQK